MTDQPRPPQLPHHRLVAFHVAVALLLAIKAAHIRDAKLRDEALRAAKSTCCNIAEGAGRFTRPDKGPGLHHRARRGPRSLRGARDRGNRGRRRPGGRRAVSAHRRSALRAAHGAHTVGALAGAAARGAGWGRGGERGEGRERGRGGSRSRSRSGALAPMGVWPVGNPRQKLGGARFPTPMGGSN